jgi:hypothetical protein
MMKKTLVKAAVLGGITVFVWGVVSWMTLPWHTKCMHRFRDQESVAKVIQEHAPKSGVYVVPNIFARDPNMSDEQIEREMKQGKEMMMRGPFVFAVVTKEGMKGDMTAQMFTALIIQIISAYFIAWMLTMTKAASFMRQVGYVAMFGFIAGLLAVLPAWNWWGVPLGYTVVHMLDLIIGWFFGGLVIVKLLKR